MRYDSDLKLLSFRRKTLPKLETQESDVPANARPTYICQHESHERRGRLDRHLAVRVLIKIHFKLFHRSVKAAGEDADDMYPAASGLRMLGDNLVAARARLSRGRGDGKAKSNNVPPSARENRGGANKSGAATAKPGGRW